MRRPFFLVTIFSPYGHPRAEGEFVILAGIFPGQLQSESQIE